MEALFTNDLVHRRQLGTHSPGNGPFSREKTAVQARIPFHRIIQARAAFARKNLGAAWHGPMPPRTVLSLPTTCRRFHRPRPPGIFRTDQSTLGWCVPCPSAQSVVQHRSLCRSWPGEAVPSQRRHKCCVNGQLGPVEQTEPVNNFQPPGIANSN